MDMDRTCACGRRLVFPCEQAAGKCSVCLQDEELPDVEEDQAELEFEPEEVGQ